MLDVNRVVDLKVDDLIVLNRRIDDDIDILIEGTPKFTGTFGIYKGSYGLKVRQVL